MINIPGDLVLIEQSTTIPIIKGIIDSLIAINLGGSFNNAMDPVNKILKKPSIGMNDHFFAVTNSIIV
tara:strand:+ start:521 stop:724 length:204 start_codon:yes stop_codon:yes gene_type:complete